MKKLWLGILGGLALASAGGFWSLTSSAVDQPIAFNHRLHVQDVGLDCADCHVYAMTGVRATIPNVQICAGCHVESQGESAEEARVVEHVQADRPILWRKVYWVPDHVFFSHRRHTAVAEIACEACHGEVGAKDEPVKRQAFAVTMDRCMDCHYEKGASNDCIACHR